ncbi:MAG: hypothetical protein AAFO94_16600 [Bacteroidota bacterium]
MTNDKLSSHPVLRDRALQNIAAALIYLFCSALFLLWMVYIDEGTWRKYDGFLDFLRVMPIKNDFPGLVIVALLFSGLALGGFLWLGRRDSLRDQFWSRLILGLPVIPIGVVALIIVLIILNTLF